MKELISLCESYGVSGCEKETAKTIYNLFSKSCDNVYIDKTENVIGVINPDAEKSILLEAHMDEIGLIVKKIDSNGYILFDKIGGVNPKILPASEVCIHGKKDLFGVIGAKPPHLISKDEKDKDLKIDDLFIDCGYSYDIISNIVKIGDTISFIKKTDKYINNKFVSKSLDNRMGIYIIDRCMSILKKSDVKDKIIALAAVQEEVGGMGAKTASYSLDPDFAIIFDVTFGTSAYDKVENTFKLGSGITIGVGPNFPQEYNQKLIDYAEKNNIKYTLEVCEGHSGTDAWNMQTNNHGIITFLISVPLKHMHSPVEMIDLNDIEEAVKLTVGFIEGGDI